MKKFKKATAKKRTKRSFKKIVQPIFKVINGSLDSIRLSNAEKAKLKRLEARKAFLVSEINSKKLSEREKDLIPYADKKLITDEIQSIKIELKDTIKQYHVLMGKRSARRRKAMLKTIVATFIFTVGMSVGYLTVTGALTVFGF